VDRFAQAIGSKNPLYGAEGSENSKVAPPSMRLQDYALLIAQKFKGGSGGVHAKHWCEFYEPMRVGQTIKVAGRIIRTYRKRGKFYFEVEYESRDAVNDQLLMRQAITAILLRGGTME
jgi:acyl-CoA thioesterase FadM